MSLLGCVFMAWISRGLACGGGGNSSTPLAKSSSFKPSLLDGLQPQVNESLLELRKMFHALWDYSLLFLFRRAAGLYRGISVPFGGFQDPFAF